MTENQEMRSRKPLKACRRPDQGGVVTELWVLLITDGDGDYVRAIEETGDPILAYRSQQDAIEAADDHLVRFGIECVPVRIMGDDR